MFQNTFILLRSLVSAGVALVLIGSVLTLRSAERLPNIILIVADDLGYGDLGSYGQEKIQTPNLDQLAREGMRFTQFYAGSAVGEPSRAALFTGSHTGHITIRGNRGVSLAADDPTLSQMIRAAGFRVTGIGRWGMGEAGSPGEPRVRGFDQWVGNLSRDKAFDYFPNAIWRYDSYYKRNQPVPLPGNQGGTNGDYLQDVFNKAIGNAIRIDSDFQYFHYFAFTIPHVNPSVEGNGFLVPNDAPYSAKDWPEPARNRAAMITRMDQSIGMILDHLKRYRVYEDSLILFTSDNGPDADAGVDLELFNSAGGLHGAKGSLHEGGIRVPLIAWWPGKIEAGKVIREPWAAWDLLPTLAELIEVEPPEGIDGISLLPTLLGNTQTNRHDTFYWELHEDGFQQAVRLNNWKGIRKAPEEAIELYNLEKDEKEENDVAGKQKEVVARIEELMKKSRWPSTDWPVDLDDESATRPKLAPAPRFPLPGN